MTRGDCMPGGELHLRPCPLHECRHRLGLSGMTGESCALDVADRGPQILEDVGRLLDLTRERIRQIEVVALRRLKAAAARIDLDLGDMLPRRPHPLATAEVERDDYLSPTDTLEIREKCDAFLRGRR